MWNERQVSLSLYRQMLENELDNSFQGVLDVRQTGKATPRGAVAKFAASGKPLAKKDLAMLALKDTIG